MTVAHKQAAYVSSVSVHCSNDDSIPTLEHLNDVLIHLHRLAMSSSMQCHYKHPVAGVVVVFVVAVVPFAGVVVVAVVVAVVGVVEM